PTREEHEVVVGASGEEVLDPVLVLRLHPHEATSAAALRAVRVDGQALDVARVGDGDDHLLVRDEVLDREVGAVADDLGAALVAVGAGYLAQLLLDDLEALLAALEDRAQLGDERADLGQLVLELLDLEAGQPREAHVEDRLRLAFGEPEALLEARVRGLRVRRALDQFDDLVDVVDGDLEPLEDVLALEGLGQVVLGPADDDLVAVVDEVPDQLPEVQHPRDPA